MQEVYLRVRYTLILWYVKWSKTLKITQIPQQETTSRVVKLMQNRKKCQRAITFNYFINASCKLGRTMKMK